MSTKAKGGGRARDTRSRSGAAVKKSGQEQKKAAEKYYDDLLLSGQILAWGKNAEDKVCVIEPGSPDLAPGDFDGRAQLSGQSKKPVQMSDARAAVSGFRLFAGSARPGTGIVAVRDGQEVGPRGALGLFLAERKDPREIWCLAPAHLVMNLTEKKLYPDVYRSQQGLTAGSQRRKLGTVRHAKKVVPYPSEESEDDFWNDCDAGLIKVDDVNWKQKTTCYGLVGPPKKAEPESVVRKCGPEEPHSTWGEVFGVDWKIRVVHEKKVYLFKQQIMVRSKKKENSDEWLYRPPFALPGDSGSLVVDDADRRPVGMLMAGSVRDNYYFLNPIMELQEYWSKNSAELVQAQVAPAAEPPRKRVGRGASLHKPDQSLRGQDGPGVRSGCHRATVGR